MHRLTFYPLGNADCCLIELSNGKHIIFDFADVREEENDDDLRIDLQNAIRSKLEYVSKKYVDVLTITHGDRDHYNRFSKFFYLLHNKEYQSDDRIKINELWVPAAIICDDDLVDEAKILQDEARYRLKNKTGIKIFSRPEAIKEWFEKENLNIDDYRSFFVDAGKLVPGYSLATDDVEFFVHSPFASRQDDGSLVERNECSIVVQACFNVGGVITNVILSADTTWELWEEIVRISKCHKNEHRLSYHLFKLPHHCSYLSLSDDKGKDKTIPKDSVDWMFNQGLKGAIIISTSKPIPSNDDDDQPPHRQAANYYKDLIKNFLGDFVVTMENPNTSKPEPVEITIDNLNATLKKTSIGLGSYIGSRSAQRAG